MNPLIAATTLLLVLLVGKPFISFLQEWKVRQSIRVEGPQSHQTKAGTPTMGGWLIVLPAILVVLLFDRSSNTLALCGLTLAYALLGWLDDFIGIARKQNKGLSARAKMGGQILIAGLFSLYLYFSGHGTSILLPYFHTHLDLGWFYYPWVLFVFASYSNAVNLTDGLDGLASTTSAVALLGLAVVVSRFAPEAGTPFLLALLGGCLGFLWFNGHPASVFMGDTGSLALGGALAGGAILGGLELFLIPLGAIFVAETLSVVIQVAYFKRTKRRVFRMAPLHHHFELGGWKETKVVWRFFITQTLFVLLTIGLL
ncbi:MAG: phospho-N-acetylmuramoyl-pentapeptide-transferase [Bacteroidota bacterium]